MGWIFVTSHNSPDDSLDQSLDDSLNDQTEDSLDDPIDEFSDEWKNKTSVKSTKAQGGFNSSSLWIENPLSVNLIGSRFKNGRKKSL